jgi:chromosome segregation ATPase
MELRLICKTCQQALEFAFGVYDTLEVEPCQCTENLDEIADLREELKEAEGMYSDKEAELKKSEQEWEERDTKRVNVIQELEDTITEKDRQFNKLEIELADREAEVANLNKCIEGAF